MNTTIFILAVVVGIPVTAIVAWAATQIWGKEAS